VPAPPPDAGVPPYDAGEIGEDASFPEEDAGNDGDDAGDAGDGGRRRPIPQRVGCACHVGQQGHAMRDGLAAVGLLAAAFAVTRRRRR
jgi:MYXO-CTERM domain-containing protein